MCVSKFIHIHQLDGLIQCSIFNLYTLTNLFTMNVHRTPLSLLISVIETGVFARISHVLREFPMCCENFPCVENFKCVADCAIYHEIQIVP